MEREWPRCLGDVKLPQYRVTAFWPSMKCEV